MSPGLKKGGHLNITRRTVDCIGPSAAIPRSIEVDVSTLDFGQRIYISNLSIPAGVSIVGGVPLYPVCCFAYSCCVQIVEDKQVLQGSFLLCCAKLLHYL
jgi:large subunit ribosomal protein L25